MIVVAGPPGSGKSTRFPLSAFGVESFNADDRAAEMNSGSFRKIPNEIREQVNVEFRQWILSRIRARSSFALETTLRSTITFEQTRLACENGFQTYMHYVGAGSVDESVRRVIERAYLGGHSASERLLGEIYAKSTKNLFTALRYAESFINEVHVYDNSVVGGDVERILIFRKGAVRWIANAPPFWLDSLLRGTEFDLGKLRRNLK